MKFDLRQHRAHDASLASILHYNAALLAQAHDTIGRLLSEADPAFRFAQAVGPHLRHVLDHYKAFMAGLGQAPDIRIAYDMRERDMAIQNRPTVAMAWLAAMQESLQLCADSRDTVWGMDTPVQVEAQAGLEGEFELSTSSTLGRELLFLSSHTVHHFALVSHYCKAAGVDMGADFGKAPATVAFERMVEAHACA